MIKVAIVTFHQAINYGAVLQTYALQTCLENLKFDVHVLNYYSDKLHQDYKLISLNGNITKFIKQFITYPIHKFKYRKFKKFTDRFIRLTNKMISKNQLDKMNFQYDFFITGSDQVWNYKITNKDSTYFLDFVSDNAKKCSYAASFGLSEIPIEYQEWYKRFLKTMFFITVREKQGAKLVEQLIDKNVPVVLDPTLLLTNKQWKSISTVSKRKKYVLLYMMQESENLFYLANQIAKKLDCDILYISYAFMKKHNVTYIRTAGPQDFLGLFMYAEYILTNSFHGTAFSINFNKKFLVEYLCDELKSVNSRLENIITTFKLEERVVVNGENDYIYESIDYQNVNQILDDERKKSIGFLKEMLAF